MLELVVMVSIYCGKLQCPRVVVEDYSSMTSCELAKAMHPPRPDSSDIKFCTRISHEIVNSDVSKPMEAK